MIEGSFEGGWSTQLDSIEVLQGADGSARAQEISFLRVAKTVGFGP
jgi:hypothetical protein